MNKIEYRAVIKFLTKQGKPPKTILEEMLAVYGDDCPSKSTICEWSKLFKHGRESLDDDPRSGRPVDVITSDVVEKTKCLVLEDARLKKRQLAATLGVSETTVFRILHEYLGMTKVSARWVPRILSPFQMRVRVETCEQFLALCGDEPDLIINRLVTGDETWVHHYDPESKQESMQFHVKGSSHPKKFKVTPSAGKIMATIFWDSQGILLIDYMNKGNTVTGEYYANLMHRLRDAIKVKRRGKLTQGVLLLHDNAPVHKSRLSKAAVADCGFVEIDHPPYSPDLAPSDYFLFPNLKKTLRGTKFRDNDELIAAVEGHFAEKTNDYCYTGLKMLLKRCNTCIQTQGSYIEK
jgi:[histone H3]-lysine36 N-dimethyltransferase SETMAR